MGKRRLVVVWSAVLALSLSTALAAQEGPAKRFETRDQHISRSQAIGLSLIFPGLGQLATGHRHKGTALMKQGGTFEAAEDSWQRLSDKKDDLDRSHLLRRAFGVLSLVVYGYNALDVLIYDGAKPAVEKTVSIAPMPIIGTTGLALGKRF